MSSQIDPVILALFAKWTALTETVLAGVRVADGPQVNSEPSTEWLFVGYDGAETSEFVEGAVVEQDLITFARGKKEGGEVKCGIVAIRGDPDIVACRQRALTIMSVVENSIRTDMTLGGAVMHAYVSAISYIPSQPDKGAKVRVVFTVTYQAQF